MKALDNRFYVKSMQLEIGLLVCFQNFVTIRRAMWSKENILGCLSNQNKGMVSCCISMFGFRGCLLENYCYASLAGVLIWFCV